MSQRRPIAFMSYVRSDDDHEGGRITRFRSRLEGEVRIQTGQTFEIFQDRNDIGWGQNWKERIQGSLQEVTFLVPIVTPSFFVSPACRSEFKIFVEREKELGLNRLILPVYYVTCDQLETSDANDEMANVIRERNWTDWRQYRFKNQEDGEAATALAILAKMIKNSMAELESVFAASEAKAPAPKPRKRERVAASPGPSLMFRRTPPDPNLESAYSDFDPAIPEARTGKTLSVRVLHEAQVKPYYVYTQRFDEVIHVEDIVPPEERARLHNILGKTATLLKKRIKLPTPLTMLPTQLERAREIAILVLVDNSGSMRGDPIRYTAAWCLLISEWLETLGIRYEIAGYTTRAWRGGASGELWLGDGAPERPGRLNDLRHIIYKSFDTPLREAAANFGVMLREGLLKENIDGESLLWAHGRLLEQKATQKLLFMLSDGAPVDDATLSANPSNFLEVHVRSVSKYIDGQAEVDMVVMGIGHDVSRYYGSSKKVKEPSKMGPPLVREIMRHVGKA